MFRKTWSAPGQDLGKAVTIGENPQFPLPKAAWTDAHQIHPSPSSFLVDDCELNRNHKLVIILGQRRGLCVFGSGQHAPC